MPMKNTDNVNHGSRMVQKTKDLISIIFLSLVSLLSLTFCIGLLLTNASLKRQVDASRSELDAIESEGYYTTAQAEKLVQSVESKAKEEALDEIRESFRESINEKGSLYAIREMFPDNLIVASGGEYRFYPIDESIEKNMFSSDDFSLDDKGWLEYSGNNSEVNTFNGVQVSRYQKEVDFEKVKQSGIDFVMLRAGLRGTSEGTILEDDYFKTNIKNASSAGLDIGIYFESAAVDEAEAKEEAEFVLELISDYEITYPIAILAQPAESDDSRTAQLAPGDYSRIIDTFCKVIEDAGYKSIIYGNILSFTELVDKSELADRNVWISYSGEKQYYPYRFDLWEYTKMGVVDGIDGSANLIISVTDFKTNESEVEE